MGRHAAGDDAPPHPLVAAALAQRLTDAGGAHRGGSASSPGEGGLGWPGSPGPDAPEPGGGSVGWPGGGSGDGADGTAPAPENAPEAGPASRRGWRRFFGAAPAA